MSDMLSAGVVQSKSWGSPYISKSTYLAGLQCDRLLWFRYNAKDQLPPVDAETQAIFDQGKVREQAGQQVYYDTKGKRIGYIDGQGRTMSADNRILNYEPRPVLIHG